MQQDKYEEVLAVIVAGIAVFLLLAGAIVFFMLHFQKKKFQHYKELAGLKEDFEKNLLQSRIEIQEQTFDAISREIHDNVGQLLSLSKLQLSIAEQSETTDKTLIADIKTNIGNVLTDLRDIAKSLNSDRLQQLTLTQAVAQELQRINRFGFIATRLESGGTERPVVEQKKIILFRVTQECLQNILKHANATEIAVDMRFEEDVLQIDISDNGIGFDAESIDSDAGGLGLQNIKTRIALIGGELSIISKLQKGTHISLKISYE